MQGDRGMILIYEKWHFGGDKLILGDSQWDNPLTCTVQWLPIVGSNWLAITAWVTEFIYHMPKSSTNVSIHEIVLCFMYFYQQMFQYLK